MDEIEAARRCSGCRKGIPKDRAGNHREPQAWDGVNDRITPCYADPRRYPDPERD